MKSPSLLAALTAATASVAQECPPYTEYASEPHEPYSEGIFALPFQRPSEDCRTYVSPAIEQVIQDMEGVIADPDLYRFFVNAWPSTVDTTVLWRGTAEDNPEEELSFIITGDINAMWLRDSANQLQSYKPALRSSDNQTVEDIATLYRGAINLQGRYLRQHPYCNAFQPPPESGIPPGSPDRRRSIVKRDDVVSPPYDPERVWECKYELDSLAAFFQLSWDYYDETRDAAFFSQFSWAETARIILDTARDMMQGTYAEDGSVNESPYTWERESSRATETVANNGYGEPIKGNIGLVRSFFRPSDDATTYQYLIPSNMMFASYLAHSAEIAATFDEALAVEMQGMADGIIKGIEEYAVVEHPKHGKIYAFEVNGYGSYYLMDDANLPSLLSAPHLLYPYDPAIYDATRSFVLSSANPYYAWGPVLNATGGPHLGPGNGWPMGVVMQIMTSDDDAEISGGLRQLLGSTSGLGLMHETVNSHDDSTWTRPWFAWANGLFGQMILNLAERKPEILAQSFQN